MAEKRKSISKKLRFEVFKRDNFMCQYCGQSAPDVVLEVDHINPVNAGGGNDIVNLITSCFDCNRGKGARKLTESQEVKKQQEQLAILGKRREQMEMIIAWKKELSNLDNTQVDEVERVFSATGADFSETGRRSIRSNIKRYGFETVLDATYTSVEKYFDASNSNSAEMVFEYIGRIANTLHRQKTDPLVYPKNKIVHYCKNNYGYFMQWELRKYLDDNCMTQIQCETLMDIMREVDNYSDFRELMEEYFAEAVE